SCGLLCVHTRPAPSSHVLSLHDALPISLPLFSRGVPLSSFTPFSKGGRREAAGGFCREAEGRRKERPRLPIFFLLSESLPGPCIDRKSTRLNSSHVKISYAVFCFKKKST